MAEFSTANVATVSMKVNVTTGGRIAQSGDTVTSSKKVSIAGIKATATLSEAKTVYDAFYGNIAGGSYDSLSAEKSISVGVDE